MEMIIRMNHSWHSTWIDVEVDFVYSWYQYITMIYIILFSSCIAVLTATHSLLFFMLTLLLWLSVLLFFRTLPWKRLALYYPFFHSRSDVSWFQFLIIVLLACCSVIVYDRRMLWNFQNLKDSYMAYPVSPTLSSDITFIVTERDKMGRYSIQTNSWDQYLFLLYSSQDLVPGDVFLSSKRIQRRDYNPQLVIWIPYFSSRQSGQVMDNPRFDYNKRLYMQWLYWSLYDNRVSLVWHQSLWTIATWREQFYRSIVSKYTTSYDSVIAGLLAGMTIWDRSLLSPDWYQQFIDSGLVHLIAVSGGNIAIVVLFIGLLLFWMPFYLRQCVLIVCIVWYALVVWNDSSIIRATIMWLLTLIALFPGRQLSLWRSMAYARCLMLLWNPYYLLYDLWFGLSFAALSGIAVATAMLQRYIQKDAETPRSSDQARYLVWKKLRTSWPSWIRSLSHIFSSMKDTLWDRWQQFSYYFLKNYIVPTLWATIGVTPLLLRSMQQTNILSPLINICIIPFVPMLTIAWFLLPFLYSWTIFDSVLVVMIQWLLQLSARWREYGIYLTISDAVKDILFLIWLWWWLWVIATTLREENI